jgi:tetratricopeptide (TPR) repeat protein
MFKPASALLTLAVITLCLGPAVWAAPLEDAQRAFREGDYSRAVELAAQAHREEPSNEALAEFHALALNALGVSLVESGDWEQALEALGEAVELLPGDEMIAENLQRTQVNAALHFAREEGELRQAWTLLQGIPRDASQEVLERRNRAASTVALLRAREAEDEGEREMQRRHLETSLRLDPENVASLIDMAEWHYGGGEHEEALEHFRRAQALDPSADLVSGVIDMVERDLVATQGHVIEQTEHFTVSHPGASARDFADMCLEVLERGFAHLSQELGHTPQNRIEVVIYPESLFQNVTLAPDWAMASFDGKIRIIVTSLESVRQRETLFGTLHHEMTHAFIYDIAGQECPDWLNEGLAQCLEPGFQVSPSMIDRLRTLRGRGELPAITDLPFDFGGISSTQEAQIAYLAASAFTHSLMEQRGAQPLRDVLRDLAEGMAIEEAVLRRLQQPLEALDQRWRESL